MSKIAKNKSGCNVKAIDRHAGYKATMSAMDSKTRSSYKGSSKHNRWESKGDQSGNDNLRGYGK